MYHTNSKANQPLSPFNLPSLPFAKDALQPHMTAQTFDYHHGKHHAAYVTNLNNLLANGHALSSKSLEEVIVASHNKSDMQGIFNNAAQVWNHSFFWHCLSPNGGGKPEGKLLELIERDFGSFEGFTSEFKQAGATQFGSGWAWLVWDSSSSKLKVIKTSNAETPLAMGMAALLTADVWEHAYYLDYQNRRPDYLQIFLDHLVNWDFAAENLDAVLQL